MAHEFRPAPMSLAQRAALRQQQPQHGRQRLQESPRRSFPIGLSLALLLVVLIVAGALFEYLYRDRILPRVQVESAALAVGGLTRADATARLHSFALEQRLRQITLLIPGDPPLLATAGTLGYRVDAALTAWRAYNVGRDIHHTLPSRLLTQGETLLRGATVPVAQRVNTAALTGYLFRSASTLDLKARHGIAGRRLNVGLARQRLAHLLVTTVGPFHYTLPFISVPPLPVPPAAHKPPQRTAARTHSSKKKAASPQR